MIKFKTSPHSVSFELKVVSRTSIPAPGKWSGEVKCSIVMVVNSILLGGIKRKASIVDITLITAQAVRL